MNRDTSNRLAPWVIGLIVGWPQSPAHAADTAAADEADVGSSLAEIVVTAQRRAESLEKVPTAITALSASELAGKSVQGLIDLRQYTPSLQIDNFNVAPMGLQISMRGQVQTDTSANNPGSVGVYIDDVYDGGAPLAGTLFTLGDLRQVEVIKGPQGTLYGRNVTAGLIKFDTNKPINTFEGSVTGGIGNYARHYGQLALNAPIVSDVVAFRLVASGEEHSGYSYDVISHRQLEDLHKTGFRAALKVDPVDRLDILLQSWGGYGRDNGIDARTTYLQPGINTGSLDIIAAQHVNGLSPGALAPLIFGAAGGFTPAQIGAAYTAASAALPAVQALVAQQLNASRGQVQGNPLFPSSDRAQLNGTALTISYQLASATLKSITAYDRDLRKSWFNVGGGPWEPIYTNDNGSTNQLTEELNITGDALDQKLRYSGGVYLFKSDIYESRLDASTYGAFPLFLGKYGLGILNGSAGTNYQTDKSAAVYSQATYSLTDKLHFTGGLRWTTETIHGTSNTLQLPDAATLGATVCIGPAPDTAATPPSQCAQSTSVSNHNISYTAGLDQQITRDMLLYVKTSRGFKTGGVNAYSPAYAPFGVFRPEIATVYEGGLKAVWLDRRVMLNAAYYHTNYNDIQLDISEQIAPGLIVTEVQNAAKATIQGVELDARVAPFTGVTLGATGSYTDAYYKRYQQSNLAYPGGVQDLSRSPFQGLSRWTGSLSAAYAYEISRGTLRSEVDWAYLSSANLFANDTYPSTAGGSDFAPASSTSQGGYALVNASLSLDLPSYHSTVSLWGKNLTNKRYLVSVISLVNNGVGVGFGNFGPPTTVGLDYTYHF